MGTLFAASGERLTRLVFQTIFLTFVALFAALPVHGALAQTFTKSFTPSTIGPGAASTATFTIFNNTGTPITGAAFTDVLPIVPGAMTIATPANASMANCDSGGATPTLTAPDGGGTISLSGGAVGVGQICTIKVDVTASTAGAHTNPAVTLTSSAGAVMSTPVDLTVVTTLPAFSKSFAPSTVNVGERSTLTFTIDNALNASAVGNLDFTDNLPLGIEVASPSNAATDCVSTLSDTTLTAVPGTTTIDLDANGSLAFPGFEVLPIGASCTVAVDVVGTAVGTHDNSVQLLADFTSAGSANAALTVTGAPLLITKQFTDDPVGAGGTVTLEFSIQNNDRNFSATGVAFTDDLTTLVPALAGLTYSSLLSNDCGGSISGVGGTTIGLSGGTIAPEGTCTIRTSLTVPGGTAAGTYTNTTGTVSATVDGSPVVGNMASDDLFVSPGANVIFTKQFLPNSVNAGGDVTLRFTIDNTNGAGNDATDITFSDELTDGGPGTGFLPFPVTVTLPPVPDPPCGAGSSLGFFFPDTDRQGLRLTGGSIAAGASCTFDVTVTIPAALPGGTYTNTTGELTSTIAGATRMTPPASADLTVSGGLNMNFSKSFSGAAVQGGTVDLTFDIENAPSSTADATAITFTDDLAALIPAFAGLNATLPPSTNTCGGTLAGSAGDTLLTYTGGTLIPGASCQITVSLNVPAGAAVGTYANTTSLLSATPAGGTAVDYPAATADLVVAGLGMSKTFLTNPALAGGTTVLEYTIENFNTVDAATGLGFTESYFPGGWIATDPPVTNTCGGTATIITIPATGSFLTYAGGTLATSSTCVIGIELTVPAAATNGLYPSAQNTLSGTYGVTPVSTIAPQVDLEVNSVQLLLTKSFTDDPVAAGDPVTLEFTIANSNPTQAVSAVGFTDDLGAALAGLIFDSVLFNDCAATVAGTGTDMISVSGGSITAAGSCTIRTSLTVPGGAAAGAYTNTTGAVTGMIGGVPVDGAAASDDLNISDLVPPTFSKAFDGPSVAGGTPTLTFDITNNDTVNSLTGLGFTDNLDDVITGLVATGVTTNTCGGTVSGTSFLTLSGGTIAPSASCTIVVDLLLPGSATAGTFPNTTSDLLSNGLKVQDPATADLTIEPPPTFAKVFAPDSIQFGGVSTLTFTIDNSASALSASALDFTDNLPAGVTVATPANAATTCTGGTVTAAAGSGVISYTGGTVAAGASCTLAVDVTGTAAGAHINTTGDLTSSSGNSGTATDTLTVLDQPPLFSKLFSPDAIQTNALSILSFTIDNTAAAVDATGLDFTDVMPAAIVVAPGARTTNSCTGGTLTAAAGTNTISYTGGTVSAGATCVISVEVQGILAGTHTNTTGDLTSALGNSGTATDDLGVTDLPPIFSKVFAPDTMDAGDTSTLTFTINNTVATVDATALDFTDNMPTEITVASPANASTTCTGGTLTAVTGTSLISYTGGTVTASSSCTINVDVTSAVAGSHANSSGDLTSSLGNSGIATDTLNVNFVAPVFSKQFAPDSILSGEMSTLTFTIDNSGSLVDATALDFTDNMPVEITVATPSNASTTCTGGTLTAVSSTSVVSYTGGTASAGASCTISVDVISTTAGSHVNTTGDLTSDLGNSGTATDTLDVTAQPLPVFTKLFAPDTIVTGTISTLTFTIDNSAATIDATALDFTDNMPAGMVVATPANASTTCTAGTVTATSGSGTVSYTGGTIAASATCTIQVDITSTTIGANNNVTGDLTSSLGNSGTATDTLTVDLPLGTITIVKNTAPAPAAGDGTFEFTSADPDFDAISLTTVGNTATSEAIAKAAGVYTVSEDIAVGWVLDALACTGDTDGGSVIDLANREVAIDIDNGEAIVCTFTNIRNADEVVRQTQEAIMKFMEHRADQMTANQPDLVTRLKNRSAPGVAPLEFTGSGSLASSNSKFSTSLHKVKTWHSSLNGENESNTPSFDIWVNGFLSHTNTTNSKSHLGMVHLGADYLINPNLVVGGIVQLDWAGWDSSTTVATVDGFGWMAGPYFVANPWQNIYIDGRVHYGQSYNDINPIGTYTDQFDTDRFLASLQITGSMSMGNLNVNPAAELLYFHERQKTYIDTIGNTIPSQTLELGRVIFGPQFSYDMVLDDGSTLTPTAKFEGIWDFRSKTNSQNTGATETIGGLRGRVDLGLGYRSPTGTTVRASGFYDGIGRSGFESYGGQLDITIPLHNPDRPE